MGAELFAVPFACTLVLLCVLERAMHAVMCLVFRVPPWKQMAAQSVLVRQVEFLVSLGTVFSRALVQVLVRLLGMWILFVTAFVIFSMLSTTFDEYPETWLGFVAFYNANIGPVVSFAVTVPLQIADVYLRALLPLYDAAVWWGKTLMVQVRRGRVAAYAPTD